jgi:putative FmdB family regulatory protein
MPTYDYRCLDCGHAFEEFQSMTDEQLKVCPECGGSLKRLIGKGAGIIFRGSGFYATDYKGSGGLEESSSGGSSGGDDKSCPGKSCSSCSSKC